MKAIKEKITKAWKDYTIKYAIMVTEKATSVLKLRTINSCWRKLCPDFVYGWLGYKTEPVKKIMEEIVAMEKKVGGRVFQDTDLGEIKELIDTLAGDLKEMNQAMKKKALNK